MSTSRVIVGSSLAIQSLPISQSVPPIGELPTSVIPRPNVPTILSQNDSLFIRESIGSATVEKRLDLDTGDNSVALTSCKNESSKQFGLSVDRPVVLAAVDVFSQTAISESDGSSFKETINQNLDLLNFENDLLQSDYNFLMNKIEADNEEIVQSLKSSLATNELNVENALGKLNKIAFLANETSKILDFARSENNFEETLQNAISGINFRFDESRPSTSAQNLHQTSTSLIKRIEEDANADIASISKAEYDLILKLEMDGTAFSDKEAPVSERTPGDSYNKMDHLEKTIVCCKVLSKLMAFNFSKSKLPDFSRQISLPISLNGQRQNFIFESSDVTITGSLNQFPQRGSALSNTQRLPIENVELSVGGFHPEKSLKNNNYDSLMSKAVEESAASKKIIKQFEETKASYYSAYSNVKFGQAVGFNNEECSPQDILMLVFQTIFESFPTYTQSLTKLSEIAPNEMIDALAMSLACRKKGVSDNVSGLFRSILLSSISDPDYKFGESDEENFDSVTESKTTTSDGTDSKTIRSNSGTNQKSAGRVESVSTSSKQFYEPLNKRGFIPQISKKWIQNYLEKAEKVQNESKLLDIFVFSGIKDTSYNLITNKISYQSSNLTSNTVKIKTVAKETSVNYDIEDESFNAGNALDFLFESIKNYGKKSNSTTIKSSIDKFYKSLIDKFSSVYKSEINESSFMIPGKSKTLSKNSVLDLIFECISNCLIWSVNPAIVVDELDVYITPNQLSKISITNRNGSKLLVRESLRLLSFMKNLSSFSGGSFLSFVLSTDNQLSKLIELLPYSIEGNYRLNNDTQDSDYLVSLIELSSLFPKLTKKYRESTKNLATIEIVVDSLDKATLNLLKIQEEVTFFKSSLLNFSEAQKIDTLRSLSVPSLSSTNLKNLLRKTNDQNSYENLFEKTRNKFDISATKWFFTKRTIEELNNSKIVFVGFPQGFLDGLTRQAREYDSDTFLLTQETPVLNKVPNYFKISSVVRSITKSTDSLETDKVKFSHMIDVQQISEIDSTSQGVRDKFDLYIFDLKTQKWERMNANDTQTIQKIKDTFFISESEANEIVGSHILDSIHKSVARVTCGLDVDFDILGTFKKSISTSSAQSVIQVFSNDVSNLLPRGSLKASDFLSFNPETGFIEVVPYSKLKGNSSNLTNPSEHSLLTKILNTRIFTKDSLEKEVLLPSAFERVYAFLLNKNDVDLGLSQIVTSAVRI